jgi:ligand-binding sensor domain-containing protein/two-component sensor histidine kinase
MKYYATILAFFFSASNLHSQHLNLKKYTIDDGLPSNDIRKVYQDSEGFIWIATMNGLSRYDGYSFTNYSSDQGIFSVVNDMIEIEKGKLLVAQNNGAVSCIENGKVKNLYGTGITINQFVPVADNKLYLSTDNHGIAEWKDNKVIPINSSFIPESRSSIQNLVPVNDSLFWGYNEAHLFLFLIDKSSKSYSMSGNVPLTYIFKDSRQRVWIGNSNGLKILSPSQKINGSVSFDPLPPPYNIPQLDKANITSVFEDSKQNLWIGCTEGILIISKDGGVTKLGVDEDLGPATIRNFFEDREQNIWIADMSGLIKISAKNEIRKYGAQQGTRILTWNILPVSEKRVLLFSNDVRELDIQNGLVKPTASGIKNSNAALSISKKEILVSEAGRFHLYTQNTDKVVKLNLPVGIAEKAISIDENNLLIYLRDVTNLYIVSKTGKLHTAFSLPYAISFFAKDKEENIWIGTFENGLYKVKISGNWDISIIDSLTKELPDLHIRSLFIDSKDQLWVGTRYKGLCKVVKQGAGAYHTECFQQKDGLSDNWVFEISEGANENIWVGTNQGIDKLIPVGNQYRIFNFGRINNISGNIRKILITENGWLVATGYPDVIVAKDEQLDTLSPPLVHITSVHLQNNDTINDAYIANPKISYSNPRIDFNFSALQFFNEKQIFYSYRLLGGSDTNWSKPRNIHEVFYANLKPGNYHFEVRALGWNGQWGKPAVYSFIVLSPFWQKWWFIAVCILMLGSLVYLLYRYSLQQLIRLQKVRNRIATDLHDEIGSNLTNISILSSLTKKNIFEPNKAGDFLQRISEEVSSSSHALDDIIWSVNTSHDTMEQIVARMRRYAAELFDAANIRYEFYLDPAFEEKKIDMEQRRDVYLLYKEAVNNISKHAGAKQVSIHLAITHNQLLMQIKDDGKSFDTGKEFNRHGLKGMKERVSKWKGKIEIESAEQKGTTIRIRLPLAK